jgi:hypothetical protein
MCQPHQDFLMRNNQIQCQYLSAITAGPTSAEFDGSAVAFTDHEEGYLNVKLHLEDLC